MDNQTQSILENAFHILKANYTSSHPEVTDLADDAEFEETFSLPQIQRAQQNLLAPLARLEMEISWLPELSDEQISSITALMVSGDYSNLFGATEHLPELAKSNILSHLTQFSRGSNDVFHKLIKTWEEVDISETLDFLNENRSKAGFPNIDTAQLEGALRRLMTMQAKTAAIGVWALEKPGETMDQIVEYEVNRDPSSPFLAQFVRQYDLLSEPDLATLNNQIDDVIKSAEQEGANLNIIVDAASELLVKWDEINQPVQVYEQQQGHEEGRSKRVYEKLRQLCLTLANERGEYDHAKRLSAALLHTFPELESVAEVLRGDVAQLETLVEQKQQSEQLEPLVAACEAAKSQLPKVKRDLAKSSFSTARRGPVTDIYSALVSATSQPGDHTVAFLIIRDLALFINNERNDPETAFGIINGLIHFTRAAPSAEVREKLDEERAVLHRNWKMEELERNRGNVSGMSRVVDEMLVYARGNDKLELVQLKEKITQKKNEKIGYWVVIGGIILLLIIFGG
ncbi:MULTISPECIES: hypothetical protein [Rhodobacterales]|uniref:hypothetical protein n=1 Tax=Rhodobacterales TaxID=204455 RepID=UPI00058FC5B2|nr:MULTISPECIES: hypothetical protein [Rhodobacterales]KII14876.1 hypothetical protein OO25_10885 [Phaeobacter sp. S60]WGI23094.1 hypothetical protein QBD29_06650 [Amylibacter sp. IMCC11727]